MSPYDLAIAATYIVQAILSVLVLGGAAIFLDAMLRDIRRWPR